MKTLSAATGLVLPVVTAGTVAWRANLISNLNKIAALKGVVLPTPGIGLIAMRTSYVKAMMLFDGLLGTAAPVPLNALTVSVGSATVGKAVSSTISNLTAGSSLALTGAGAAGLSISGAVIGGTPTTPGPVDIVETPSGGGTPRTTSGVIMVAAAPSTALFFGSTTSTWGDTTPIFGETV